MYHVYYKTQKFKHLIFFFATELCESFIHFGYQPLIRYMICKNILTFGRLPSHFVDDFTR